MKYRNGITWLTYLSIDAPLVAIIWQNAVSTLFGLTLDWHHRVLVFISVWLGYSADRWFDTWRHQSNISQRHQFFSRYRWPIFAIWVAALLGALTLALQSLSLGELTSGFGLTASSIAVTLIVQLGQVRRFHALLKSILTASLVSASVLLFALPENWDDRISSIALLLATFTLNCSLIHYWDRPIDAIQENSPNDSTRFGELIAVSGFTILALCVFHQAPLYEYSLTSAILLAAIHVFRDRLHPETRRTYADLSLLTPLVLFL